MTRRLSCASLALVGVMLAGEAHAAPEPGIIAVQGSGIVEVAPDIADVAIGVDTEDATPAGAIDANSAAMSRVVADAKRAGVDDRDIQTGVLQLDPYGKDDRGKEILRYRALNTVRVRVRDIARLGAVMRDLVGSGANRIQGVRFSSANPTPHLDQARRQAVADAKRRASRRSDGRPPRSHRGDHRIDLERPRRRHRGARHAAGRPGRAGPARPAGDGADQMASGAVTRPGPP